MTPSELDSQWLNDMRRRLEQVGSGLPAERTPEQLAGRVQEWRDELRDREGKSPLSGMRAGLRRNERSSTLRKRIAAVREYSTLRLLIDTTEECRRLEAELGPALDHVRWVTDAKTDQVGMDAEGLIRERHNWVSAGDPVVHRPKADQHEVAQRGERIENVAEVRDGIYYHVVASAQRLGIEDAGSLSPHHLERTVRRRIAESRRDVDKTKAFRAEELGRDILDGLTLLEHARVIETLVRSEEASHLASEVVQQQAPNGRMLAGGVAVEEKEGEVPAVHVVAPLSGLRTALNQVDSDIVENLKSRGATFHYHQVAIGEDGTVFHRPVRPTPVSPVPVISAETPQTDPSVNQAISERVEKTVEGDPMTTAESLAELAERKKARAATGSATGTAVPAAETVAAESRPLAELRREAGLTAERLSESVRRRNELLDKLRVPNPDRLDQDFDPDNVRDDILAALRRRIAADRTRIARTIGVGPEELEAAVLSDPRHVAARFAVYRDESDLAELAKALEVHKQALGEHSRAAGARDDALVRAAVEKADKRVVALRPTAGVLQLVDARMETYVIYARQGGHVAELRRLERKLGVEVLWRDDVKKRYMMVEFGEDGKQRAREIEADEAEGRYRKQSEPELKGAFVARYLELRRAGIVEGSFGQWLAKLGPGAFDKGLGVRDFVKLVETGYQTYLNGDGPEKDPAHPARLAFDLKQRRQPLPNQPITSSDLASRYRFKSPIALGDGLYINVTIECDRSDDFTYWVAPHVSGDPVHNALAAQLAGLGAQALEELVENIRSVLDGLLELPEIPAAPVVFLPPRARAVTAPPGVPAIGFILRDPAGPNAGADRSADQPNLPVRRWPYRDAEEAQKYAHLMRKADELAREWNAAYLEERSESIANPGRDDEEKATDKIAKRIRDFIDDNYLNDRGEAWEKFTGAVDPWLNWEKIAIDKFYLARKGPENLENGIEVVTYVLMSPSYGVPHAELLHGPEPESGAGNAPWSPSSDEAPPLGGVFRENEDGELEERVFGNWVPYKPPTSSERPEEKLGPGSYAEDTDGTVHRRPLSAEFGLPDSHPPTDE